MQAFLVQLPHHAKLRADSSSHSFMAMYDKHWGCNLRNDRQTLRQVLTFSDVILQAPFGESEEK